MAGVNAALPARLRQKWLDTLRSSNEEPEPIKTVTGDGRVSCVSRQGWKGLWNLNKPDAIAICQPTIVSGWSHRSRVKGQTFTISSAALHLTAHCKPRQIGERIPGKSDRGLEPG